MVCWLIGEYSDNAAWMLCQFFHYFNQYFLWLRRVSINYHFGSGMLVNWLDDIPRMESNRKVGW